MALALAWLIESLVKTSHPKGVALRFISSALIYVLIAAVTLTGGNIKWRINSMQDAAEDRASHYT